jgi:carbon starvation protein
MHALYVLLPALAILAIAYRYYSAFLATRVWMLDDARTTPAHTKYDGANFYPTSRWVMFGHHFAAITGAGPLVGPMLAAQFGYAPGFIWLVAGCCLAGAVHDGMVLWASTRRGGKSLPDIVKQEISPFVGFVAAITIILILVVALAGLGVAFVNALADSVWGTFTVAMTIPLGMFMGMWMYVWRKGRITEALVIGVWPAAGGISVNRSAAPPAGSRTCSTCRAPASWSRSVCMASRHRCCRCGCCSRRAVTWAPSPRSARSSCSRSA